MTNRQFRKKSIWMILTVLLLTIPRTEIAYVFYILGTVWLFNFSKRVVYFLTALLVFLALLFFINYLIGYSISPTGFVLALALHLPLFIFIIGGTYSLNRVSPREMFRLLNLVVFILSIYNMTVNFGFPVLLPYIHYLPDAYAALYDIGGAKIVTVIGFFGLAYEMYNSDHTRLSTKFWILIASANFIIPSYLIGTVCGFVALILPNINNRQIQLFTIIVGVFLLDYIVGRVESINTGLQAIFGAHPKILAFIAVVKLYYQDPSAILFGTGIGQFASTAAEWGSEYLGSESGRVISIPGLFMSSFHEQYIGIYLQEALVTNIWLISSSMNKPYSSISVILAEFGLLFGGVILYRIFILLKGRGFPTKERFCIIVFVFSIFVLDVWHDSLWFLFLLILYFSSMELKAKNTANNSVLRYK